MIDMQKIALLAALLLLAPSYTVAQNPGSEPMSLCDAAEGIISSLRAIVILVAIIHIASNEFLHLNKKTLKESGKFKGKKELGKPRALLIRQWMILVVLSMAGIWVLKVVLLETYC